MSFSSGYRLPELSPWDPGGSARFALAFPLPGSDPAAVRDTARNLRSSAGVLRASLTQLRTLGHAESFWVGSAADEFSRLVAAAPRHIDAVCSRYEGYAAELDSYAGALESARTDVLRHRGALQDALTAWTSAPVGAPERPELVRALTGPYLVLAGDYEQWLVSAARTARRLHRLDDHDALHNPHGWHALVNAASTICGELSQICALVAVLCIVVCPIATPFFFAASAVFSAVQLVADTDRAAQYEETVTPTQFAVDGIAAMPFSGIGKAGVAGVRAARAADGIGRGVVDGVSASGRSIGRTSLEPIGTGFESLRGISRLTRADAVQGAFSKVGLRTAVREWEELGTTGINTATGHDPIDLALNPPGSSLTAPTPQPGDSVIVTVDPPDGRGTRRLAITIPGVPR